ncbi:MAG: hypothetical protein ACI915_000140 [Gammaproteobacteria bacterium]|jgi:hypothetical protein
MDLSTEERGQVAQDFPKEVQFKTYWHHRKPAFWFRKSAKRGPGVRTRPEIVRLDPRPDVEASDKPPVRIFLGSESEQYRAERIFIWSIIQIRDPARSYEIHLMKDLHGYDRTGWKTGFTKYRYAIPAFAEGTGRAIYNDVDQIYLADPAELFDMEMGDAGVLSITGRETSVMLLDCARMTEYWRLDDAQAGKPHRHFRDITHVNNLWGQLPHEWNARDAEYSPERSKCFHFTTLQTQPWQPFKDLLNYRPHPNADVWFDLERSADDARFTVFTKEKPSQRFNDMVEQYRVLHDQGDAELGLVAKKTFDGHSLAKHDASIGKLVAATRARSILDYGCGKALAYSPWPGEDPDSRLKARAAWPDVKVTCYDPGYAPYAAPYCGRFDGVISTDVLEHIPEEDIGWVLNELFGAADKFVYVVAACYLARKVLPNGQNAHCTVMPPAWWAGQLALGAQRFPGIHWKLCTEKRTPFGKTRSHVGGCSAQQDLARHNSG